MKTLQRRKLDDKHEFVVAQTPEEPKTILFRFDFGCVANCDYSRNKMHWLSLVAHSISLTF